MKTDSEIKMVKAETIKPYDKNAKVHTPEQVERVAESIKQFGFIQPLVVTNDNVLIIGHCRFAAAQLLGLDHVPAIIADHLNANQIKALRLADNKLNESYWDNPLLEIELAELKEVNIDMSLLGFTVPAIGPEGLGEDFVLPSGDKNSMQQITFTLTNAQMADVRAALSEAMNDCPMPDESGNENKNGNAIFYICQRFLENL